MRPGANQNPASGSRGAAAPSLPQASRLASAHTVMTAPTSMNTIVRPTGARGSEFSSSSAGGRIKARPLPATRAPPNAKTSSGRRFSPRKSVWAITTSADGPKFSSRGRSAVPMVLVFGGSPPLSRVDKGGSHELPPRITTAPRCWHPPWLPPLLIIQASHPGLEAITSSLEAGLDHIAVGVRAMLANRVY